ncbi:hypothetical protein [Streptomyces sp. NPDC059130]|uniref:hypothetical protein n=1 Tax=unclassified Streptomyces TaxID=2593676 RepID=UPI0036C0ABE6
MQALGASPRRLRQWERAWDRIAEKETPNLHRPTVRVLFVSDNGTRDQPHSSHQHNLMRTKGPEPADSISRVGTITFEIDPLHPHGPLIRTTTSTPLGWSGPQPSHRHAGQTPSGLPIRTPRRQGPRARFPMRLRG